MEWNTVKLAVLFLFFGSVLSLPLQILLVMTLGAIAITASLTRRTMTTDSHSSSSAPISDLAGKNYDVFLSFRGPDTRRSFTDILHQRLTDAEIHVFLDDNELPFGEPIKPELIKAIKQSEVLIPIISADYASSRSCLMELVEMLECKQRMSREIIPIFYEIDPSDLKEQKNSFAESFREHRRNGVNGKTIEEWKLALKQIGSLRGFETEKIHNGLHSKIMDKLIPVVLQTLKKGLLPMEEYMVGVDHHVQKIMRKLGVVHHYGEVFELCRSGVQVLGIYGIGGVGKSTIAKFVYNQLYGHFQGYSYVDIPKLCQDDLTLSLQNKLISDLRKRTAQFTCSNDARTALAKRFQNEQVLILLDGMDNVGPLNSVVQKLTWFGQGSRIIVTSRKSNILQGFKEAETYEVEAMEEDKALQLFSKLAFGRDCPDKGFESLSKNITEATGRVPLALEVTGKFLSGKPKDIWKETLDQLKDAPHEKVKTVLKISYNALADNAKQIFLDIACFLIGKGSRIAFYMWEDCKLCPHTEIDALRVQSLVKIGENDELLMHDLLRTLGRSLVKNEDPVPRNRSRLWMHNQALSILQRTEGTPTVQALGLAFDKGSDDCFTSREFDQLSQLRFLDLDRANMRGNFTGLLSQLRWLRWQGYHKSSEPLIFCLENLVILDLSWSAVADDWEGWTQIIEKANKLKVLDLSGCSQLRKTPCFPAEGKLERLILEGCSQLSLIDKSIGKLKYLKSLNIKSTPIVLFPKEMGSLDNLEELLIDKTSIRHLHFLKGSMEHLKTLSASGCKSLAEISKSIGYVRSLSYLALDEANIPGLPDSVTLLKGLEELSLRDCQQMTALPVSIEMLTSLQKLDLSNTKIKILPKSIKYLVKLQVLRMEKTHISKFPDDITNLGTLQFITFSDCQSLNGKIMCDISGLSSLRSLDLSYTRICSLPESIYALPHLQTLHLLGCDKLQTLPSLPSSLVSLRWGTKNMRIVLDFSNLTDLKVLELVNVPDEEDIPFSEPSQTENFGWISSLSNLETLKLCLPNVTSLPEYFDALTRLKTLDLSCINLLDLPQLPSSLSKLLLKNCKSQRVDFSNLEILSGLELCDCNASEILGLGNLRLLQVLKISGCNMKNLDGLEQSSQLRWFSMSECLSLDRLPDLSRCASLKFKEIVFCNIQD